MEIEKNVKEQRSWREDPTSTDHTAIDGKAVEGKQIEENKKGERERGMRMTELEKARDFFGRDAYATEATGIVITEVGDHYAKVELDIQSFHRNALGAVMGGVYFTMADFAFAVASNRGGEFCVTQGSHISYLNPAKGEHLIAETRCLKNGRRTCCYEIEVRDELGTEVAKVTADGCKVTK